MQLQFEGVFLRINQVIGPNGLLPISRSAFYAGIKAGKFPRQYKLGPKTSVWSAADIKEMIAKIERGEL